MRYYFVFIIISIATSLCSQDTTSVNEMHKNESRIGNRIKINIHAASVIYNSYCNVPRKSTIYMTSSEIYKQLNKKQNISFNIGLNSIIGMKPHFKYTIGLNYIRTQGEFFYSKSNIGYNLKSEYKSIIHFINFISGPRFSILNKIHIEPLIAINVSVKSKNIHSGSVTTFDYRTPPYTRTTESFSDEQTSAFIRTVVSFVPRVAYEINIKNLKTEIFYSYNISYRARLPWHMLGVAYYPFKKLK